MKCILRYWIFLFYCKWYSFKISTLAVHLLVYRKVIKSSHRGSHWAAAMALHDPWPWASTRATKWPRTWASRGSHCHRYLTKHSKFCRTWSERCVALPPMSSTPQNCARPLKDKRALQFIKQIVGTHIYVKGKREELSNVLAIMRKTASKKDWPPFPV